MNKKMHLNIIILLLILLLKGNTSSIQAQGIKFENKPWEEALQKAKEENKIIFIDFYTSWCAPCKKLAKEIFPQKEVGDFFNKNFICCTFDAEKEGEELARKYKIRAYPTLLFLDRNGNELHRKTGYLNANKFINLGNIALDPKKRNEYLEKEFEKGNRDIDFLTKYFDVLKSSRADVDSKLGEYLVSLPKDKMISKEIYNWIDRYASSPRGIVYRLLIDNFYEYSKIVGKDVVEQKVSNAFKRAYSHHVGAGFAEKYIDSTLIPYLKTTNYPHTDKLIAEMELVALAHCYRLKELSKKLDIYLNKYGKEDIDLIYKYVNDYYHLDDPDLIQSLIFWLNKVISLGENKANAYYLKALLYEKRGDLHSALEMAKEALNFWEKENIKIDRIKFLVKRIEDKITGNYDYGPKRVNAISYLNKEAPDFVVGKWISEKPKVKGKFLLIDFWATWCTPCRKGIPLLNSFHKKYAKDLIIIGITDENEGKLKSTKGINIDYYIASDTLKRMSKVYKIKAIPHVVIVDPQGIVRWEGLPHQKGYELTEDVLKKILYKN